MRDIFTNHVSFVLILFVQDAPGRISFTFDGWTSKNMTAYFGMMSHYITSDWQIATDLISFNELGGSHSGENQAAHMYKILKRNGIIEKVCHSACRTCHSLTGFACSLDFSLAIMCQSMTKQFGC